ncbi:transcriptional repressor [Myxococcota bacterium]|nr:transcriptional repressor [Myxococcota bacterium]
MQTDAQWREVLSERGLRVTRGRLDVLAGLEAADGPLSHPELTERLAERGLDRATVYRNLISLAEAGLLIATHVDRVTRYELRGVARPHHEAHPHLVCTDCHAVRCLPASSVTLHGIAATGEVDAVELRGRCAECRAT